MRLAAGLLVMMAVAGMPLSTWAVASDLAGRQSEAERQQAELRARIVTLQKNLDQREAARQEAADALKQSESAISALNFRLRELTDNTRQAEGDLALIERQIVAQNKVLSTRRAELADQLRAQYSSGLSPWAALLSGGDPQDLGRDLGYLDYVSRARAHAISELRLNIDRLATLQSRADARREDLKQLAVESGSKKEALLKQQQERATLVAQLEGQISAQRAEAVKLGRDDQRLSHLIGDLGTAIQRQAEEEARRRAAELAQRRAEEARREEEVRRAEAAKRAQAQRQAQEARQAKEAQRLAAEQAHRSAQAREAAQAREQAEAALARSRGTVALNNPEAAGLRPAEGVSSRLTTVELETPKTTPTTTTSSPLESKSASETEKSHAEPLKSSKPDHPSELEGGGGLRRGLALPVRGPMQGRFGVSRPEGGVWRGIVLRAAEGTPVKVVAPGVVVYAEWLRGFGNLIIVDHGQQYLTVYAYNQSLLKRVGDRVATGDTIASVGATGGQVESGLYFEIRHRGAPIDPAQWLVQ